MSSMVRFDWNVAAVAALLLVSTGRGDAAEGRIPISAATTITESGSYFLSQDIENLDSAGNRVNAIVIAADHVTLDLDSHSIKVVGAFPGIVVIGYTDVEVRNGKIFAAPGAGTDGVHFNRAGGQFRVRDLSITGFQGAGISAYGDCGTGKARLIAVGNTVQGGASFAGIFADCVEASRIEQNDLRESYLGILLTQSSDTLIGNNVVSQNSNYGIRLEGGDGNTIERNTVTANGSTGISLYDSSANSIVHNNASKNVADGISLDGVVSGFVCTFNQVSYNTTSFNGGNGIFVNFNSNQNSLDWNQSSGNASVGIHLQGIGNVYSNNRARANGINYIDMGGNDNVIIVAGSNTPTNR